MLFLLVSSSFRGKLNYIDKDKDKDQDEDEDQDEDQELDLDLDQNIDLDQDQDQDPDLDKDLNLELDQDLDLDTEIIFALLINFIFFREKKSPVISTRHTYYRAHTGYDKS